MARDARAVAVDALLRIEEGAYANLVLSGILDRASLTAQDRRFVTELVYGTTRMRRACDWLVDRFLMRPPDARTRAVLRVGAYQLVFLGTPPHAAVSATVGVAPGSTRGLVNAVLRRVAAAGTPSWPSDGVRLSYPDWIIEALSSDLGGRVALEALTAMNSPPPVTTREDGYTQDLGSQWVVAAVGAAAAGDVGGAVGAGAGCRVADICAAPGGKATGLASAGARVVAMDVRPSRTGLVVSNAARLGLCGSVAVVAGDGTHPPLRPRSFDVVLVDAPCSGLGVLRRRPDARWRIGPSDVSGLAALQQRLLVAASDLVVPGGLLAYSVCTLTAAETIAIDEWAESAFPSFVASPPPPPWRPVARGGRLLPQDEGTDGMYLLLLHSRG